MAMKLDLLPTERKKFGFDIVIALMFVLIAVSGIGFYLYGNKLKEDADAKKLEVAGIQKKIEEEKKDLGDIEGLRAKLKDLQANIDTVKTLKLDPVRYSNLLDELSSLLPNNMWVSSVAIDTQKNTLTIAGVAAEQPGIRPVESISGFMKSVSRSKYFKRAVISSTTRGTVDVGSNKYTSYSWNIELEYDKDKAINSDGRS